MDKSPMSKSPMGKSSIGKSSFAADKIAGNARELLTTLVKLKPQATKGVYIKSIHMSSTMSPSVEIDTKRYTED